METSYLKAHPFGNSYPEWMPSVLSGPCGLGSQCLQNTCGGEARCTTAATRLPSSVRWVIQSTILQVSIDPRGLERGRVYFTSVKAYNASNVEKGVMFEVPITIVVPFVELYHGYQYSW